MAEDGAHGREAFSHFVRVAPSRAPFVKLSRAQAAPPLFVPRGGVRAAALVKPQKGGGASHQT